MISEIRKISEMNPKVSLPYIPWGSLWIGVHGGGIQAGLSKLAEFKTEITAKGRNWLNSVVQNIQKDGVTHTHTHTH